jgi:nicotinate-nucleotide--dimethylbenzimidazole phosphoribosyltransferase
MVLMVGAMLSAAEQKAVLLIDGFIATSAVLIAAKMQPNVLQYCIFSHCSDESGHQLMLDYLKVKPLLNLGLRLGEGTGAVLAYPIVQSAVNFLNEMASFESAGVSEKC